MGAEILHCRKRKSDIFLDLPIRQTQINALPAVRVNVACVSQSRRRVKSIQGNAVNPVHINNVAMVATVVYAFALQAVISIDGDSHGLHNQFPFWFCEVFLPLYKYIIALSGAVVKILLVDFEDKFFY